MLAAFIKEYPVDKLKGQVMSETADRQVEGQSFTLGGLRERWEAWQKEITCDADDGDGDCHSDIVEYCLAWTSLPDAPKELMEWRAYANNEAATRGVSPEDVDISFICDSELEFYLTEEFVLDLVKQ